MIFDDRIKKVIAAAFSERQDVFLRISSDFPDKISYDDIPCVYLFPGAFSSVDGNIFTDGRKALSCMPEEITCFPIFADVRFLKNVNFRNLLRKMNVRRIVIPFAECALEGEYIYRESFSLVGEFRDETEYFCQVVAFLPPCNVDAKELMLPFGCENVICAGENEILPINPYATGSPLTKFYHTAAEAEKYAYKKVLICFNSRGEAKEFAAFLNKRGTPFRYIDGETDVYAKRNILDDFFISDISIILSTRTVIPETLFFRFDKCIFCGVPFTFSHIFRCAYSSCEKEVLTVFCEEDFVRNAKISRSLAHITGNEEIYDKRHKSLLEIQKLLSDL